MTQGFSKSSAPIVIIGLGAMGSAMGTALTRQEYAVVGVEPFAEQRSAWAARTGFDVYATPQDAPLDAAGAIIVAVRTEDQVTTVLDALPQRLTTPVFIVTTLSISFARRLVRWSRLRIIEASVSGGPWGAEKGEVAIFLHAPGGLTARESDVVSVLSSSANEFANYGEPATAKLVNNALGAYNAMATARMIDAAAALGLDRSTFLDIANRSSGHSWMSEHFHEFPADLLAKDVRLLRLDLPLQDALSLDDPAFVDHIAAVRSALSHESSPVELG